MTYGMAMTVGGFALPAQVLGEWRGTGVGADASSGGGRQREGDAGEWGAAR